MKKFLIAASLIATLCTGIYAATDPAPGSGAPGGDEPQDGTVSQPVPGSPPVPQQ